jgi:hypothetical protein
VVGGHDLGHRLARGLLAEQLDEEHQAHGLAMHRATAGSDDLEVFDASVGEANEAGW